MPNNLVFWILVLRNGEVYVCWKLGPFARKLNTLANPKLLAAEPNRSVEPPSSWSLEVHVRTTTYSMFTYDCH